MDPQTKKFTTSRDVMSNEVSTTFPSSKPITLDDSSLEVLFPEIKVADDDKNEA
ncbi:uncharacterized protein G2W53_000658 [Senna tora]|uniref:Uncharacterized protein n=1 Tax=Senna tora TaxID=362788 RepID=A0A834XFS8_9FABA|nr:uncharacterized protein G2W53_000658 [Senna tora]